MSESEQEIVFIQPRRHQRTVAEKETRSLKRQHKKQAPRTSFKAWIKSLAGDLAKKASHWLVRKAS